MRRRVYEEEDTYIRITHDTYIHTYMQTYDTYIHTHIHTYKKHR